MNPYSPGQKSGFGFAERNAKFVLKKNIFARAAHFKVYVFAVVLFYYNVKLPSYAFYGGKAYVFLFAFFSLPLIFT